MNRLFCCLALLGLALSSLVGDAVAASSRPLSTPAANHVAYITQEVLLNNDSSVHVKVAPLTVSTAGLGAEHLVTTVPGSPGGQMPKMALPDPATTTQALREAKYWVSDHVNNFSSRLGQWLASRGLSMAYFTFTQEFNLRTQTASGPSTKKASMVFFATVDADGRAQYGDPKIVDADPLVLEVQYVPLRALDGLPANWKFPDAGYIRYRLLDKTYQALTGWSSINANGAYDEPDEDAEVDPDKNLACLMDHAYGGCTGPTDVRRLMDQTGASYAFVGYIRRMAPLYVEDPSNPDEGIPKAVYSVNERIADCDAVTNNGTFGFELELRAELYLAKPGAPLPFQLIQEISARGQSPTESYSRTLPLSALGGLHPDNVILDPHGTGYWRRTDQRVRDSVVYIAPLTVLDENPRLENLRSSPANEFEDLGGAGNTREYWLGVNKRDYLKPKGNRDRQFWFNLKNPQSFEEFKVIHRWYDDHMMLVVNGQIVFLAPYSGNMLQFNPDPGTVTPPEECKRDGPGERYRCHRWEKLDTGLSGGWVHDGSHNYNCSGGLVLKWVGDTPYCYKVDKYAEVKFCRTEYWQYMDGSGTEFVCYSGCPDMPNQAALSNGVQYLNNDVRRYVMGSGSDAACRRLQVGDHREDVNIDLRPYLKQGENHILLRTVVSDEGVGAIKIRLRSCSIGTLSGN